MISSGAQPPTPEWGVMISEGRNYITTHWWLTFFPAMAMLFAVAGFNLVGDGCATGWIRGCADKAKP